MDTITLKEGEKILKSVFKKSFTAKEACDQLSKKKNLNPKATYNLLSNLKKKPTSTLKVRKSGGRNVYFFSNNPGAPTKKASFKEMYVIIRAKFKTDSFTTNEAINLLSLKGYTPEQVRGALNKGTDKYSDKGCLIQEGKKNNINVYRFKTEKIKVVKKSPAFKKEIPQKTEQITEQEILPSAVLKTYIEKSFYFFLMFWYQLFSICRTQYTKQVSAIKSQIKY